MTNLEDLKKQLQQVEAKYGKDSFVAKSLRDQIDAESSQPTEARDHFVSGGRPTIGLDEASDPPSGPMK